MANGGRMLFNSFFMAGFECSSHRRKDGVRLDLIRATAHDTHALADYQRCAELGIYTIRDGLRWHLIERQRGEYDWSSWITALEAGKAAGVQIIWDMFHYGSPDFIDQGSSGFIDGYAAFAAEAVRIHRSVTGSAPLICPIEEWMVQTPFGTRRGSRHQSHARRGTGLPFRLGRTIDPRSAARQKPSGAAARGTVPAGAVRGV